MFIKFHLKYKTIMKFKKFFRDKYYNLKNFFRFKDNKINLFYIKKNSSFLINNNCKFSVIDNYNDYKIFLRKYKINSSFNPESRFKDFGKFVFLYNSFDFLSYGWIYKFTKESIFNLEEISIKIKSLNGNYILYDFLTNSKYRNKGFYKKLLNIIISILPRDSILLIYALSSNIASNKGILASGFNYLSTYSYKSKKIKIDLSNLSF